ncbi:MAG: DUF2933 domain-containing protein [Mycobacteriales bacterium]
MNKDKYPLYGLVAVVAAGLAVWAGLPPTLLLLFLVCPLMMFFMMRGMHSGHDAQSSHSDHGGHADSRTSDLQGQPSAAGRGAYVDGSHERIDHP